MHWVTNRFNITSQFEKMTGDVRVKIPALQIEDGALMSYDLIRESP